MATISENTVNINDNYYSETHATDVTTLDQATLDAAKLGRFYIEFSEEFSQIGPNSAIKTGTMSFTDTGGTTPYSQISDYAGNQSAEHMEIYTGDAYGSGYDGWSSVDEGGRTYEGTGIADPQLVGIIFNGNQSTGEGTAIVGIWAGLLDEANGGSMQYFFFPLADQVEKIELLDLPDADGNGGTAFVSHVDTLSDGDQSSGTIVAYVDLMDGAALNAAQPNYIVEGTAGGDLIDGTYLGDPDGDLIDNNDGRQRQA